MTMLLKTGALHNTWPADACAALNEQRHIQKGEMSMKVAMTGSRPQEAARPTKAAAKRRTHEDAPTEKRNMKKAYIQNGSICQVTFRLPHAAAPDARHVSVVGDFNNWDPAVHSLKKLKNGDFTAKIKLQSGRDYQFRYWIDSQRWENDWQADSYVQNPSGDSDNSVVSV
jgi:1,4-alpha-glucan branching enzyme